MIRRPPRSTRVRSSAASDVYKRQAGLLRRPLRPSRSGSAHLEQSGGALRGVAELVGHEGISAGFGERELDQGAVAGWHVDRLVHALGVGWIAVGLVVREECADDMERRRGVGTG